MDPFIDIAGLVKRFGRSTALDGLDLTVGAGEVHGFLGPNGSGKSTTLRILLGLLRADGGNVRLFGQDPWRDAVQLHRRLAYVPGEVRLWPNLTGGEVIDLLARLRGGVDAGRLADLIARFELDPTKRCRSYSKGNRQKVILIGALASDADLLLLDEPTSGLDPLMETVFTDCIRRRRDEGGSVLLSSHILGEVERLCDRATIIRAGRTAQTGTLQELRHLTRVSVTVELAGSDDLLPFLPGVHDVSHDGPRVRFHVDADELGSVMASLAVLGIRTLTCQPPTLDELFLSHYGVHEVS